MSEVVVLSKVPVPGQVKTRLVSALGEEGAAELHVAMARDVFEACEQAAVSLRWNIDGDLSHPWAQSLVGPLEAQSGGNLGDRLVQALGNRGVALGSDSPTLPPSLLRQAATCEAPVLLGPSFDGGCWCIGWNQPCPEIFEDISWSTPRVMSELVLRVRGLGILPEHRGRHSRQFFQSIKGGACPS